MFRLCNLNRGIGSIILAELIYKSMHVINRCSEKCWVNSKSRVHTCNRCGLFFVFTQNICLQYFGNSLLIFVLTFVFAYVFVFLTCIFVFFLFVRLLSLCDRQALRFTSILYGLRAIKTFISTGKMSLHFPVGVEFTFAEHWP